MHTANGTGMMVIGQVKHGAPALVSSADESLVVLPRSWARPNTQVEGAGRTRIAGLLAPQGGIGTLDSARFVRPEVSRFYAPGILGANSRQGPLISYLQRVAMNGGVLFLRGEAARAGTTQLVTDFINAWNANATEAQLPQVAYARLAGCKSAAKVIDAIASSLGLNIHAGTLRGCSLTRLADGLVAKLLYGGYMTLVIDHVREADECSRGVFDALMQAFEQAHKQVAFSNGRPRAPRAMGLVLVDSFEPKKLFLRHKGAFDRIRGNEVVLPRYRLPEDMGAALQQASVGFASVDPSAPEIRQALVRLLEMTHGLPVWMEKAFEHLGELRALNTGADLLALVEALPLRMKNLSQPDGEPAIDDSVTDEASSQAESTGQGTRAEIIAGIEIKRGVAAKDHKKLLRKKHVTPPTSIPVPE